MQEQMKQQFEQFQRGVTSAFQAGPKLVSPALRGNEVMVDSLGQMMKDQLEFSCSCLDVGRRQMESLAESNDATALFRDSNAPSEYYSAATRYGEALRENAENTRERMLAIAREATDTATSA